MCDSYKTKYIYCINRTCKCESYKIFDTTAQKCKYNYLGCVWDGTNGASNIISSSLNNQLYFVDICINACRFNGFNQTYVFRTGSSNGINGCNCIALYNMGSPSTCCDAKCPGKDGEVYYCGLVSINSNCRSVYSTFDL
jgi:hypothetical protein